MKIQIFRTQVLMIQSLLTLAGFNISKRHSFKKEFKKDVGSCHGVCSISSRYEKINDIFSSLRKMEHTPRHPTPMDKSATAEGYTPLARPATYCSGWPDTDIKC